MMWYTALEELAICDNNYGQYTRFRAELKVKTPKDSRRIGILEYQDVCMARRVQMETC